MIIDCELNYEEESNFTEEIINEINRLREMLKLTKF